MTREFDFTLFEEVRGSGIWTLKTTGLRQEITANTRRAAWFMAVAILAEADLDWIRKITQPIEL